MGAIRTRLCLNTLGKATFALTLISMTGFATHAQVFTGTISGTVTDSSGAVIVGANITEKNEATGVAQHAVTDEHGRYLIPDLLVGKYSVQAQKNGFQTSIKNDVTVIVGTQTAADITMAVGQVNQTVSVEASQAQVDTSSSDVGSLIDQKQLDSLPLNGRDFSQLILLAPGVNLNTTMQGNGNMGRDQGFSVAGARTHGQEIILDGTNIQNFWNRNGGNVIVGTAIGVEAIAEFTVLTNTFGAEYGGSGAVINQVTKSGTNTFHGSAYDYLRNSIFDARNYFDPLSGPPDFRRNQYGGSLGGPIKRGKVFFFVNYEGISQLLQIDPIFTVPDDLARGTSPLDPAGESCLGTVSPSTCYPVNATQKAALALYPEPPAVPTTILPNFGNGTADAQPIGGETVHENYLNSRLDYNISPTDSFFARVVNDPGQLHDPFSPLGSFTLPETGGGHNIYATLEYKKILSSNVINLVRFGFVRTMFQTAYVFNPNLVLTYFPGTRDANGDLSIAGLSTAGIDGTDPIRFNQNKFTESDDVIWSHGSHSVRTGIGVTRVDTNEVSQLFLGGNYTFNSLTAFLLNKQCPSTSNTCAYGPANFGGGLPGDYNSNRGLRETDIAPYYQDDWRVNNSLTLNLGLRWDFQTNPIDVNGLLHNFPNPLTDTFWVPVPHVYPNNASWKNFEPRIGFAYAPFTDRKTSIRGGFGIYDDLIQPREYAEGYDSGYPYFYGNQSGPAPFPLGFLGSVPFPKPSTTAVIDWTKKLHTPYLMEYNLNVERQLSRDSVFTIGYVGSEGRHFFQHVDLNPPVATIAPDGNLYIANVNNRLNNNIGVVSPEQSIANTNYNSLQMSYNDTFRKLLKTQISYTYSHCLDFVSEELANENGYSGTVGQVNPYNRAPEYGRCNFDVRHNLTENGVFLLPFKGNRLVDGWQINEIITARTGQAFTVDDGFDQSRDGNSDVIDRPNLVPGQSDNPIVGKVSEWFDPTAFVLQPPGEFGDLSRNTLTSPALFDLDLGLVKNTKVTEALNVQFRAEFFNILNHPNFQAPNVNLYLASTNPSAPGYINGGVPNPTAGEITSTTTTSRQIQFAVKFIF
ncbi:MAG TPA: carboxypeptidase regulatory-like domain-containing protein [Candidatus Acidoferrales bacterium]|jgi:hypothetical protein|nr:carboxypeptidase regulatory-like domain-containing protein [Candidatus Acidoferrales bacterium]